MQKNELADHILYRLYYSLILRDVLYKLGFDSNKKNKEILHEFHKRIFGHKSISGLSQDALSLFIFSVTVFWAERGIFVRSSRKHEIGMEDRPLKEIWKIL